MSNATCTIEEYIESKATLKAKVIAIDALIAAMELKMVSVVAGAAYDEYQMDDGQMKVRTKYRSVEDVKKGLLGLEQIRQMYLNRLNGRIIALRGGYF